MPKATKKSRSNAARAKAIAITAPVNENGATVNERAASIGARLIHFGTLWVVVLGFTVVATALRNRLNPLVVNVEGITMMDMPAKDVPIEEITNIVDNNRPSVPSEMLSPFGSYPNLLNISDEERVSFHPVVKFPKVWMDTHEEGGEKSRKQVPNYQILDLSTMKGADQIASEAEREERRSRKKSTPQERKGFAVGRYDENRMNLYSSDLFDDTSNSISGFDGARTVHIGIDLDGPLGTKVFAFTDGIIHKVGYNARLGDYGNVIVVEHNLKPADDGSERKIYGLYGHMDEKTIKGKKAGQRVRKGQVLGRIGDIHENGGW